MLNFENLDKFIFPGVGKHGIPPIKPVEIYPRDEFIPVNYHYTAKDPTSKIVHFFVDDYQFIRHRNASGCVCRMSVWRPSGTTGGMRKLRKRRLDKVLLFQRDEAIIPTEKLTLYALNSEKAPDKALAFQSALEYTVDSANALIQNIRDNLPRFRAVAKVDDGYGQKHEV